MRALIVIAIILAVIALILLIPIQCTAYLSYANDEFDEALDLKYGFFRLKLPHFQQETEEDEGDAEPAAEQKPGKLKRLISFVRGNFTEMKEALYAILGYLFRRAVKINKLAIKMVLGTSDAMETGLLYGAVAAFIYNAVGVMDRKMRLKEHEINLKPDFKTPHIFAEFEAIITTNLFNLAVLLVIFLRRGMPLLDKYHSSEE